MRALRDVAPPDLSSYDDARTSGGATAIPPRRHPVSMAELVKNSPSRPASNSSRKSTNSQKENEGGNNASEILPGLLWATAATITVCAIVYFVCSSSQDNAGASVDSLEEGDTTDTAAHAVKNPPPVPPAAPEPVPPHHSRPAPPAPAARPSHYQSQPLVYSRRDARAAAHLTITTSPFCALCRPCTLLLASHKRLYPNAPRVRRRFSTTQGTHARPHPRARARALIRSVCRTACQPACTHSTQHHVSPRAPHCAPAASRLSALHEARAWHAARTHARTSARARSSALCCTDRQPACTHSIQHHGHAYA